MLSLFTLTALAWVYLAVMAAAMAAGDMRLMGMGVMPSAVMASLPAEALMTMPMPWDGMTALLMALMWTVMMIGMMLPSATPMILLLARVDRRQQGRHSSPGQPSAHRTAWFTLGYLLAWTAFSVVATTLQWALSEAALVSPMMMSSASPWFATGLLVAAGMYQLSPLKQVCLQHCRSPVSFLSRHWRPGRGGAVRMGLHHGMYCVGCCWVLMALLFVGGVMNLLWVAAIAVFVLIEKVVPAGRWVARSAGYGLIAAGLGLAVPGLL